MFNLCIFQAGPINEKLVYIYPSYDNMFCSLSKFKKRKWNVEVFNIYENKFPTDLKILMDLLLLELHLARSHLKMFIIGKNLLKSLTGLAIMLLQPYSFVGQLKQH